MCCSSECISFIIMSKTLSIAFTNPTPHPSCGYKAFYRREGDSSYTQLTVSGSTSGSTVVTTIVSAPSNIEGYVISDCCSGSTSSQVPFGINTEDVFSAAVSLNTQLSVYQLTVSSVYPNPYNTLISGSFIHTVGIVPHTISYNAVYSSGSTLQVITLSNTVVSVAGTLSAFTVAASSPLFDYGGQLQQFDAIATPPYLRFHWNGVSGSTWNGSPASLPSFILNAFNITEVDTDDNTLAGSLFIYWIYNTVYSSAVSPYDGVILEVYDPGSNLIGTTTIDPSTVGLRNWFITLTRASASYPLTGSTLFTMKARWNDESLIDTHTFYLPIP